MKVKLSQIIDAMPAVSAFSQKEMPARAAYRVAKLLKKLVSENRHFIEARNKAINKYGTPVKRMVAGQPQDRVEVTAENAAAFNAEMQALLDAEVTLEGVAKVPFADIENMALAPGVLTDLDFMIEEPPTEERKAA